VTGPEADRLSALMAGALRGDATSYEEALREIVCLVRAFARARVGDTLADDVVQETLLTVHRVRHTYDPTRPFMPWLMAIAHSRLVDVVRRDRRRARLETPLVNEPRWRPGVTLALPDLVLALEELPPQQQRVIRMLKVDGMSAREVAGTLGLSVSNVKVMAHRGYRALRRRFGRAERP
jgi:RNA polymerase sigma-70 factor (ECF subfamily)